MASLFTIRQEILSLIDMETGEILDPELYDQLQMDRAEKLENTACLIKNLVADAQAYEAQEKAFAERKQRAKKTVERLKKLIADDLNGEKLRTTRAEITFRKSEAVEIEDEGKLREWAVTHCPEILTIKTPDINRTAIKNAIKEGREIPNAVLVERHNVQIK